MLGVVLVWEFGSKTEEAENRVVAGLCNVGPAFAAVSDENYCSHYSRVVYVHYYNLTTNYEMVLMTLVLPKMDEFVNE